VENEHNLKLIATLNKGIDLAKGKYIARMDADDISMPQRFQKQFNFMETNSDIGLLGTGFESFGSEKKGEILYPATHDEICTMLLYQTTFSHPTIFFRTSVFKENNISFDKEFTHAEDFELWTRFVNITICANLQEVLLKYRIHNCNISIQYSDIQEQNTVLAIKNYLGKKGVLLSDEDVRLLRRICYSTFFSDVLTFVRTKAFMEEIYCNPQSCMHTKSFLAQKWLHLCLNSRLKDRKLFVSIMLDNKSITFKDKSKLLIKSYF